MFRKKIQLIWLLIILLMILIIFFWGCKQKKIINNMSFSAKETDKWKSLQENFKEANNIFSQFTKNIEDTLSQQQTNTTELLTDQQVEELKNKVLEHYEQNKEK